MRYELANISHSISRMSLRLLAVFITIVMFTTFTGATAQSTPPCEPAEAGRVLREALDVLEMPDADVSAVLRQVQRQIGPLEAACSGLQWQGSGDWVSNVITFPDGFYRITFSNPEALFSALSIEEISGDCDFFLMSLTAQQTEGQEVMDLRECVGIIDLSARGTWFLTLEQLAP